ncbi:hypothetical protein EMO89_00375 [Bifidobacterium tissieri]|uniref:Uncharacterized protein n=1 Tax=Bifidobacterium tissieri TaxID=1630162 RepID=A0A5M9ZX56_9BIFI|nr:hypothetical protein [Bifidobacterium tissieri]KAA8832019.1 hypothetical protein EMO89_00375 [Bifidobacterium tissieri]
MLMLDAVNRFQACSTTDLIRFAGSSARNQSRTVARLWTYVQDGFLSVYGGPSVGTYIWSPTSKTSKLLHSSISYSDASAREHTLGLSSIASQLIQCAFAEEEDTLGRGLASNDFLTLDEWEDLEPDEWERLRDEMRSGSAGVVAEHEYRSVWALMMATIRQRVKNAMAENPYADPEDVMSSERDRFIGRFLHDCATAEPDAPGSAYAAWGEVEAERDYPSYWKWVLMGRGLVFDTRSLRWLDSRSFRNESALNPDMNDSCIQLTDHCADMVIARPGGSFALELERKPKDEPFAYERTILGFCTPQAIATYRACLWVVTQKHTRTLLERALNNVAKWQADWRGDDELMMVPQIILDAATVNNRKMEAGADITIGELITPGEQRRREMKTVNERLRKVRAKHAEHQRELRARKREREANALAEAKAKHILFMQQLRNGMPSIEEATRAARPTTTSTSDTGAGLDAVDLGPMPVEAQPTPTNAQPAPVDAQLDAQPAPQRTRPVTQRAPRTAPRINAYNNDTHDAQHGNGNAPQAPSPAAATPQVATPVMQTPVTPTPVTPMPVMEQAHDMWQAPMPEPAPVQAPEQVQAPERATTRPATTSTAPRGDGYGSGVFRRGMRTPQAPTPTPSQPEPAEGSVFRRPLVRRTPTPVPAHDMNGRDDASTDAAATRPASARFLDAVHTQEPAPVNPFAQPAPQPQQQAAGSSEAPSTNNEKHGYDYIAAAQEGEHLPAPGESFLD